MHFCYLFIIFVCEAFFSDMCTILGWFINNFSIWVLLMEHLHMAYHLKGNSMWINYLVRKIIVIIWMIHLPLFSALRV